MKTLQIGKHKLEVYDSIDDMPCTRWNKFNKLLIIESGLGTSIPSILDRIKVLKSLLATENKRKEVEIELDNMYQALFFADNAINPASMAFACTVKSIDGVEYTDITDSGINNVLAQLKDLTIREVRESNNTIKKKLNRS
jgi:hypothetical protein